jgi:pimeloyl-ACP methyl ester carboxylesterase
VVEVTTEVEILHGSDDPVVPPAHAHWYAAHLPCARLSMAPGELHLSMCFRSAGHIQEAYRELATPASPAVGTVAPLAEAYWR